MSGLGDDVLMLAIEEGYHAPLSVELECPELGKSCKSGIRARPDTVCPLSKALSVEAARSLEESAGISNGRELVNFSSPGKELMMGLTMGRCVPTSYSPWCGLSHWLGLALRARELPVSQTWWATRSTLASLVRNHAWVCVGGDDG